MIAGFFTRTSDFLARLMGGGTLEIVLLIVIIVVALILFLVAIWILWKLLVLLGKGLLWLFRGGTDLARNHSQARREARLAAPPAVAVGWAAPSGIGLRRALKDASRLTGLDGIRIVVVAGDGFVDLCRSLKLTPPGAGAIGIAAGADVVLIDASRVDRMALRRLANALPWWRAVDGVAVLVSPEEVPAEAMSRSASFARATGMRTALHFVLPSASDVGAWQIIDVHHRDSSAICSRLAVDGAVHWLAGGSREGLESLALAQSRGLPGSLGRAIVAAPSSVLDLASLCFGGVGLRGAVAQTIERTRPAPTPSLAMWAGAAIFLAGVGLAALVAVNGLSRAASLESTVDTAAREAAASWSAEGIDAIPSGARVRRVAGLGVRLADASSFSMLMPLAGIVPNHDAPGALGAAFLGAYVLRPLGTALDQRIRKALVPTDDPQRWIEDARLVSEWMVAWEGLDDDPREVDLRRLFATAFGGDESAWAEGTDIALLRTGTRPPSPSGGGLDVDALTELARSNFVGTMQRWADRVYTHGPIATAARRATNRSAHWREQHAALVALRAALHDPTQSWLTAARDRPDHAFELPILGRAIALSLLGQGAALEAKAAISRIRIDAREAVDYFILPEIGPLLVRSSRSGQGSGGGPSLTLSPDVEAWLAFLDRIANAGFADLPREAVAPVAGLVTVDPIAIGESLRRLRVFDQFASDLPAGLPPAVARNLLRVLTSELVVGVTSSVERALRPRSTMGIASEQAEQLARAAPAMEEMGRIESWLRDRSFPHEAQRVLTARARVAAGVLDTGTQALFEEDPLGVYIDPSADANALVRRFERGVAHLQRMYDQLAAPFVEAAAEAGERTAMDWQNISADLKAYNQGQADSTLSGLEGMVRAYAEDPVSACAAPRAAVPAGRGDYAAHSLSRFRSELAGVCDWTAAEQTRSTIRRIAGYFERNIAWLWPFSPDPKALEIPASTLDEFLRRLYDAEEALGRLDLWGAEAFLEDMSFWERNEAGGAIVRFRVFWRTRRNEERLAENLIAITIQGAEADEDGIYTWRYGSPFAVEMQLAKNSAFRFAETTDPEGRSLVLSGGGGNGALLRVFSGVTRGTLSLEAQVVEDDGTRAPLRVTARVTKADGTPLTVPKFSEHSASMLAPVRIFQEG